MAQAQLDTDMHVTPREVAARLAPLQRHMDPLVSAWADDSFHMLWLYDDILPTPEAQSPASPAQSDTDHVAPVAGNSNHLQKNDPNPSSSSGGGGGSHAVNSTAREKRPEYDTRPVEQTDQESPIYGAIIDCTFPSLPQAATQKPRMFPLGSLRYAVVENVNGKPSVGLYQYSSGGGGGGYNNNNSTNLYRTEKGITLSLQQWEALEARKSTVDWIMGAVANGKSPLAWEVIEGIPV
uniref:Uncharacterized protein n=1 Tax=Branchiostoma floridae TaxID=7739 RepID=C3ZV53_BRAFL|eukprot:XP_002587563.1 hypothetical protein BRAFLDRAFT_95705 [Branchiostoma floridae]